VIDEIQMIADSQRGWAWTNALIGLQADEIHLCGDPRAHDLIKTLCERLGDDFEALNYQRLSTLEVEDKNISSINEL
jgi:ATP-dependent RNA helicase SUPV3L1/SUV3